MEIMVNRGCNVAHCPESNMKLGAGIAPVTAMCNKGVVVGLGTDGCASNNNLDLFGEMDMVAKLHKVATADPTALEAADVVKMATIDGARAIGLGDRIGSLEVGKQADLIILDAGSVHMTPLYHPESHIVYTVNGSDVRHAFISGKPVVRDRKILTFDVDEVMGRVNEIAKTIRNEG
jgi:5-methylthioadenosine/S-adenosylhomocysteine deaminase